MKLHDPEIAEELDSAAYVDALTLANAERDRARELAAHLEEVVAMRTSVLQALVTERAQPAYARGTARMEAIIAWAEAQLSEVP